MATQAVIANSATSGGFSPELLAAPLRILSPITHACLSSLLDSHKVLLSADGLHRDWRGLAEYARLDVPAIAAGSRISFTSHCLHLWGQIQGSVQLLVQALISMDRHDVLCDSRSNIESDFSRMQKDGLAMVPLSLQEQQAVHTLSDDSILTIHDADNIKRGRGVKKYDALLLYVDEDIDFAYKIVNKMEKEFGLELCVKDRDMVAGLQFECESVLRLIAERCRRVVVLISKAFLRSSQNRFFTNYAHALSVDDGSRRDLRQRIVVPCMLEPCERPPVINFCHTLDYFRALGYWDYWQKLRDSIVTREPTLSSVSSGVQVRELTDNNNRPALHELKHQVTPHQQELLLRPKQEQQRAAIEALRLQQKKKERTRTLSSTLSMLRSKVIKGRSASESQCDQSKLASDASSGIPALMAAPAVSAAVSSSSTESDGEKAAVLDSLQSMKQSSPTHTVMTSVSSSGSYAEDTSGASDCKGEVCSPPPLPDFSKVLNPGSINGAATAASRGAVTSTSGHIQAGSGSTATAAAVNTAVSDKGVAAAAPACASRNNSSSSSCLPLSQQLLLLPDPEEGEIEEEGALSGVATDATNGNRFTKFFKKTKRRIKVSL